MFPRALPLAAALALAAVARADAPAGATTAPTPPYGRSNRLQQSAKDARAVHCHHNVTCNFTCNVSCVVPACPPPAPCPPCPTSVCPTELPATPSATPPARTLPTGYAVQPKLIYKFYGCEQAKTWDEASKTCADEGGHLAVPRTESEVYLLVGMLILHKTNLHNCILYIGVHDKEEENNFRTVLGGPMDAFLEGLWGEHQPDGEEDEQCVALHGNGRLGDHDCAESEAFACQLA